MAHSSSQGISSSSDMLFKAEDEKARTAWEEATSEDLAETACKATLCGANAEAVIDPATKALTIDAAIFILRSCVKFMWQIKLQLGRYKYPTEGAQHSSDVRRSKPERCPHCFLRRCKKRWCFSSFFNTKVDITWYVSERGKDFAISKINPRCVGIRYYCIWEPSLLNS